MRLASCTLLVAAILSVAPARADYPERPVRVVVPYSPGGPADLLGRYVAEKLAATLAQPFVIEHKPGAGLVIGGQYAAKATPDGHTLLLAASSMLVPTPSRGRTPADNLQDFACVSLIATLPLVLVTHPSLPATHVRGLIEIARKRPHELNYGSSGNGSLTHLAAEVFDIMAGTKMTHVPYRGINEAMTDLMGNRVQLSFAGAPIALPHAKSGKLRALAVTGKARTPSAPELPTIADDGLPGYEVTPWYGFVVPAATPAPVIAKLHGAVATAMQRADVKERWLAWGADATYSKSPQEFAALMRAEAAKWARLTRDGRIKLE